MADQDIQKITDGTIGWFWPGQRKPRATTARFIRGYLQMRSDRSLQLTALDERDAFSGPHPQVWPQIITGATEHGGIVLLDIFSTSRTSRFMGPSASVERFSARTLIADVDIREITDSRLSSMTAHFYGVSEWFGLTTSTEEFERHDDGRLKGYTLSLGQTPDQVAALSKSREISVSGYWRVSGPEDDRSVRAPISVTSGSDYPILMQRQRYPLLRIQDLLSVAYEGFVAASSGRAIIGGKKGPEQGMIWDQYLMEVIEPVKPPKNTQLPFFVLADLGGLRGLVRWTNLCNRHLRAVRPVVERYRQGPTSAPVRVMEVAAGIEYWVATHRRTRKWASKTYPKRHGGGGHARRLADHIGSPFLSFVGDTEKWATRFWETYNDLKHRPSYSPDERELRILAESGRLLLTAALLNRIALTTTPAKCIFLESKSRTWQLQAEVQELLS